VYYCQVWDSDSDYRLF
nr:immunoglobulin light chain junction region [Macaca mulatta]MOY17110.1 immunoglobulin light chain junction region [Macaca mulatta]MOY17350.1 immunoglobulin light chain junction region [Macaca mulatta]